MHKKSTAPKDSAKDSPANAGMNPAQLGKQPSSSTREA